MRKPNPTATTTSSSASVVNVTTTQEPQPSQVIDGLPDDQTAPAPPHDIILPASGPDDYPTSSAPQPQLQPQPPAHGPGHGVCILGHDMMADPEAGLGIYPSGEGVVGDHEHHSGSEEAAADMDVENDNVTPAAPHPATAGPSHPHNENWVPGSQQPQPQQFGLMMASAMLEAPPDGFDGIPYPPQAASHSTSNSTQLALGMEASAQPGSGTNDDDDDDDNDDDENTTTSAPHVAVDPSPQQPATLSPLNLAANPPHHSTLLPLPVPLPLPPPPDLPQGLPPNPNFIPGGLTPTNAGLVDFLRIWELSVRNKHEADRQQAGKQEADEREVEMGPLHSQIDMLASSRVKSIRFAELMGDQCDLQGVNWTGLGVRRETARNRRLETYSNYTNNKRTDSWDGEGELDLPNMDAYFRFQKTLVRRNVVLAHFQLRSVLACPSRNYAFYAGAQGVHRINMATAHGAGDVAIDFSDMPSMQVTTLDANHGVLVAGTFNGEYFLKLLDSSSDRYANGQITNVGSPITNHLQLFLPRASGPAVAFSSNDNVFRSMDVATEQFLLTMPHKVPMNCSAISPDRRLRVMVGDQTDVLIVNAETGRILQSLSGHRDFGFACDWSQDGWTVATGFQDKTVKIWDARRWCDKDGKSSPVTSIRSEMAGVRGLRFSPLGGGPRVLVAAEEADYVNIIEARIFESKQTFDLFGEIGGVAFANQGNDLNVLIADKTRGGIVKFEQCGVGYDFDADSIYQPWVPRGDKRPVINHSWSHFPSWGDGLKATKRQRAAVRERMEPF